MWGKSEDANDDYDSAISFMSDATQFGESMMKVVKEWECSCEHNLSKLDSNRRAWLGQAAVARKYRIPENITRLAWCSLTDIQREKANEKADEAIKFWENKVCQKNN